MASLPREPPDAAGTRGVSSRSGTGSLGDAEHAGVTHSYARSMAARKWSELSERARTLLTVGAVVEACLKAVALTDIARRPPDRIRGSKVLWAAIVIVVNSFGGAPLAYFAFGRRRSRR